MNYTVHTYVIYLFVSIAMTIWVAYTLHKNGRIFLVDAFHGNDKLADSVNHLLVVGFYLVNIGFINVALKYGDKAAGVEGAFETVSTKIGYVLLALGVMHFFNLYIFSKMRKRGMLRSAPPPVAPQEYVNVREAA